MLAQRIVTAAVLWTAMSSISHADILPFGKLNNARSSVVYYPDTGEIAFDDPGIELTSTNIDSAAGIFVNHEAAQQLEGSFDHHSDDNIFKAAFGSSFGSLSFGSIAQPGLTQDFLLSDLSFSNSKLIFLRIIFL